MAVSPSFVLFLFNFISFHLIDIQIVVFFFTDSNFKPTRYLSRGAKTTNKRINVSIFFSFNSKNPSVCVLVKSRILNRYGHVTKIK